MGLFQIRDYRHYADDAVPETLPGLRLGYRTKTGTYILIVADQVGVEFDANLSGDLNEYYGAVFGKESRTIVDRAGSVANRIQTWMGTLPKLEFQEDYTDAPSDREFFWIVISWLLFNNWKEPWWGPPPSPPGPFPPPPISRPNLTPVVPLSTLPPFSTSTNLDEVFYRFEPWPTSRRIDQKSETIAKETYAAPASELFFAPTGFAAVARYALPQIFPAIFRWEIQPKPNTAILCGAVVPRFGQSGGGVEVYFLNSAMNRGPIANPVVLRPL